jgi:hypothetical protein
MTPPPVIRVTADHIAHGKRNASAGCPIALAVNDCLDESWAYAIPDIALIYDACGVMLAYAHLSVDAQLFIERFDGGLAVEPFEFSVEWIDQDRAAA